MATTVGGPLFSHQNPLGRFVFRAHHLLAPRTESGPSLIGITIRRQEPVLLKLWRKVDTLPLSFREMQYCLMMASGHSQADIAQHMHVSEHTGITHRRHIYPSWGCITRRN